MESELEAVLASLLPEGVAIAAGRIGDVPLDVHAEEEACVARAVPSRRREFLTGRSLARRLLRDLGCVEAPLLPGPRRAPRWPPEVVGSIAHAGSLCVVAVAERGRLRGLGVDVEPAAPLEASLWPEICTAGERAWLEELAAGERGLWVRWFFSAKETVYKLQSPLTDVFLEFHDVELHAHEPQLRAGTFFARPPAAVRAVLGCEALTGRHATHAGFLLTAASLGA